MPRTDEAASAKPGLFLFVKGTWVSVRSSASTGIVSRMKHLVTLLLIVLAGCSQVAADEQQQETNWPTYQAIDPDKPIRRIAFGSCAEPKKSLHIFDTIVRQQPDLMLLIGDNVYADTTDEAELTAKYTELADHPAYRRLIAACPLLAVWDDHDYGINDAGAEHPTKVMSQRVLLDFLSTPADAERRKREGVYESYLVGPKGKRLQIILLDTRYHRSPLIKNTDPSKRRLGRYVANPDPAATILGEAQWAWLETQLEVEADLRLIASSIQVVPEEHMWEGWSRFPHERQRLFDLIRKTQAQGVFFISGDRHLAELSCQVENVPYPLYDLTSSSLNKPGSLHEEPNRHRIGNLYNPANFGLIEIDWDAQPVTLLLQIRDPENNTHIEHTLTLDEVQAD